MTGWTSCWRTIIEWEAPGLASFGRVTWGDIDCTWAPHFDGLDLVLEEVEEGDYEYKYY